MRRETFGRIVFLSLFAFTLYLMYRIFAPFLPGICWAIVLVVAFHPVYERLCRWLRGRTWLAAGLLSAAVAAFVVVPSTIAIVRVGQVAAKAYAWLERSYAESGPGLGIVEKVPWLADAMEWAGQYVNFDAIDVKGAALATLQKLGNTVAAKSAGWVADAFATVLTFLVLIVMTAVLFHEGPALAERLRSLLPFADRDRDEVLRDLRNVTRAVFLGVIVTAFVQAVVGAIGAAIVGFPAAVTFGAAMFFAALLPGGTAVVWAPVAIWYFAAGHPWKAVFLALWGMLLVSSLDNFLRPLFISKGVRMHTLLVFFGIFGGMIAFGLVGLFLGPIVITLFLFLLNVLRRDLFSGESEASAPQEA